MLPGVENDSRKEPEEAGLLAVERASLVDLASTGLSENLDTVPAELGVKVSPGEL